MGRMTVYHGSYTTVENPKIIKGKNTKDFGTGFYCTLIREQAERWARRYHNGMVNTYNVRMDTSLKILEFKYPTHQINFCSSEALKCLEFVHWFLELPERKTWIS